jgi:plastocyanin
MIYKKLKGVLYSKTNNNDSVMRIIIIVLLGSAVMLSIPNQVSSQVNTISSSENNMSSAASTSSPQASDTIVTIPKGAANPAIDLTLQNTGQWYIPKKTIISAGDKVTWENQDTESHTVTSGLGAGIQSVQTNEKGKPDGIFDSGAFKPGELWSRTFYNPGTYNYFCTIHPWMEAVVVVNPIQASEIPNYPVDASGNKQDVWPVHTFSKDGKYDIDLKWDPIPILTGKTETLIADFFDPATNSRLQLTPYDFVILQNGKELDRVHSLTEVGSGVHKYVFSRAGPITIRIENVGDYKEAYSEFGTIVYPNPDISSATANGTDVTRVSGGTEPVSRILNPLTLVWITYGVIFGIPAAIGIFIVLFKKGII